MKRIVLALSVGFLILILGAAGLYFLSRGQFPLSESANPQPPAGIPQSGPLAANPRGGPPQSPQGDVVRQQVLPLSDAQKATVLEIVQKNEIVSGLKERLDMQEAIVEGNGIQLPIGIVGTAIFRGKEWDMRVTVGIERRDVMSILIEKHREKQPQKEIENIVKMAENNPQVAKRLSGKKYTTQIMPPTPQGRVHVAFIDQKTKKHLFLAEVEPQTRGVRIIEPQKTTGVALWQVAGLLLLALLVAVLAYMYFSPKKKEPV
jgi:hypothetical protein